MGLYIYIYMFIYAYTQLVDVTCVAESGVVSYAYHQFVGLWEVPGVSGRPGGGRKYMCIVCIFLKHMTPACDPERWKICMMQKSKNMKISKM